MNTPTTSAGSPSLGAAPGPSHVSEVGDSSSIETLHGAWRDALTAPADRAPGGTSTKASGPL